MRFSGGHAPTHVIARDLRDPLPLELRGSIDTVFTDPPYTVEGAIFLSRAAEAVAGESRADVFFAFGGKRPEELLRVQQAIAEMGFVIRRLVRNFNEYLGAGTLGGVSHSVPASPRALRPLVSARYEGRLYTATSTTGPPLPVLQLPPRSTKSGTDRRGRRSRRCAATAAPLREPDLPSLARSE